MRWEIPESVAAVYTYYTQQKIRIENNPTEVQPFPDCDSCTESFYSPRLPGITLLHNINSENKILRQLAARRPSEKIL